MRKTTLARVIVATLIVLVLGAASMIVTRSDATDAPATDAPAGFLH
jgi:hypothetical protein